MTRNSILVVPMTALATFLSTACSDAPVDIGDKNPALAKSDLAAYAADWDGYAEAYQFEDGTDRVRLVLDDQGQGSLRFGDRALLDAPTDPTAFYPPQSAHTRAWEKSPTFSIWSGLGYTVRNARVQSERIRLESASTTPFVAYCALQTPYAYALGEGYRCLPYTMPHNVASQSTDKCIIAATTTGSSYSTGDPTVEVNCEQLAMCGGVSLGCTCSETECSLDTTQTDLSFDAALDDAQQNLVGTLLIGTERITIRLERQSLQ